MTPITVPTIRIDIFIAGDLDQAKQVCREHCFAVGLCVTVEPVAYIYTGGEEAGVHVGLINSSLATREDDASVAPNIPDDIWRAAYEVRCQFEDPVEAVASAILAERERCAKIAENSPVQTVRDRRQAVAIAAAIRIAEFERQGYVLVPASALDAKDKRIAELEAALMPFWDMAGEMFARGWNASDVALALDNPDDPHRLTAGDFFGVRYAGILFPPSRLLNKEDRNG